MLRGVYLCMKYELPHLVETGGAIVNTASGAGLVGVPGPVAVRRRRSTACSGSPRARRSSTDVRACACNAVCPGTVLTPMVEAATELPGLEEQLVALHPIGRIGTPEEIADAVLWLVLRRRVVRARPRPRRRRRVRRSLTLDVPALEVPMAVNPIPTSYPRVSPYLCCRGRGRRHRVLQGRARPRPSACACRGDSPENIGARRARDRRPAWSMLADEFPDHGFLSPLTIGGTPVTVHVVRGGRRRGVRPGARARRHRHARDGDAVLRRPVGPVRRPVGPPVERRQPRRGRLRGGDGPPRPPSSTHVQLCDHGAQSIVGRAAEARRSPSRSRGAPAGPSSPRPARRRRRPRPRPRRRS